MNSLLTGRKEGATIRGLGCEGKGEHRVIRNINSMDMNVAKFTYNSVA